MLSDKLPKTVLCVPQSARISSRRLNVPDISLIIFTTGAWKLPKAFLSGNLSQMPVKCQYKFFTRLIVAIRVVRMFTKHPNTMKTQKDDPFTSE